MSDEAVTNSEPANDRDARVARWMTQTSEAAEKASTKYFGVVRDARGKLSLRILGVIDAIEGKQPALFARLRAANQRADQLAERLIGSVEKLTMSTLHALRDGGRSVAELGTKPTPPSDVASAA
jgi:hypothetical protein